VSGNALWVTDCVRFHWTSHDLSQFAKVGEQFATFGRRRQYRINATTAMNGVIAVQKKRYVQWQKITSTATSLRKNTRTIR